MPIHIKQDAREESTRILDVSFFDETDAAVTPGEVHWTLSDENGTVINSRDAVVMTPDTTVEIVLTGDDLAILSSSDNGKRCLFVHAVYDSVVARGLQLNEEIWFNIAGLLNVK